MPIYVIVGFCVGDFIQFHHSLKDIETKEKINKQKLIGTAMNTLLSDFINTIKTTFDLNFGSAKFHYLNGHKYNLVKPT